MKAVSELPERPVYFMRSAWTKSPSAVPVFWLGDQLISYDANDGLKSVVTGALSSGLTGQAITHSDIGGYNYENISTGIFADKIFIFDCFAFHTVFCH